MFSDWKYTVDNYEENKKLMESFKERFPFTVHVAGSPSANTKIAEIHGIKKGNSFGIFDFGFNGNYGWAHIIEDFLVKMDKILARLEIPLNFVQILSIKDKFGTLMMYIGYDKEAAEEQGILDELNLARREIEREKTFLSSYSEMTCIHCGSTEHVVLDKHDGWIRPACWKCRQIEYDAFYDAMDAEGKTFERRIRTNASNRARPHSKKGVVKVFDKEDMFELDYEVHAYCTGNRSHLSTGERYCAQSFENCVIDFLLFNDDKAKMIPDRSDNTEEIIGLTSHDEIARRGVYLKSIIDLIVDEAVDRRKELDGKNGE